MAPFTISVKQAAETIISSKNVVVLTGAGISVESGIPPFRGAGGIWEKFDPMEYAHINAFKKNPEKVWDVLLREMKRIIDIARPNDAHHALAYLEEKGYVKTIITQNVDGLHQLAGNQDVIEFHGSFASLRCMNCDTSYSTRSISIKTIPPLCECRGILRPDCIFFGEMIPPDFLYRSEKLSRECDMMLIIGTSAIVQPFASLPVTAKQNGAVIIEINPEPTPLTGTISNGLVQGKAAKSMASIITAIKNS